MALPVTLLQKRVEQLQASLEQVSAQAQRAHNQVMMTQGALIEAQNSLEEALKAEALAELDLAEQTKATKLEAESESPVTED